MLLIKAVIFDMDGVISNTVPIQYEINKQIAAKLGFSLSKAENQELQGLSRRETMEALVSKAGVSLTALEIEKLSEQRNRTYQETLSTLTSDDILPGIQPFIDELSNRGIKMSVASASRNATRVLQQLGVYEYFHTVVDVTKLKRGKPDPEIFLKAAHSMNIEPKHCVAIEDGEAGLTAILQTEMFSIGIGEHETMKRAHLHFNHTGELTIQALVEELEKQGRCLK